MSELIDHNLFIQSYKIVSDINMKFLVVVPPSIYHIKSLIIMYVSQVVFLKSYSAHY